MQKEIRTVCYDDDLHLEAYRFEGIVQPFPNHLSASSTFPPSCLFFVKGQTGLTACSHTFFYTHR